MLEEEAFEPCGVGGPGLPKEPPRRLVEEVLPLRQQPLRHGVGLVEEHPLPRRLHEGDRCGAAQPHRAARGPGKHARREPGLAHEKRSRRAHAERVDRGPRVAPAAFDPAPRPRQHALADPREQPLAEEEPHGVHFEAAVAHERLARVEDRPRSPRPLQLRRRRAGDPAQVVGPHPHHLGRVLEVGARLRGDRGAGAGTKLGHDDPAEVHVPSLRGRGPRLEFHEHTGA